MQKIWKKYQKHTKNEKYQKHKNIENIDRGKGGWGTPSYANPNTPKTRKIVGLTPFYCYYRNDC